MPDVVRARRFELVDAAGKTRADLAVFRDGGSSLTFLDAAGKTRARLDVLRDGTPGLTLNDAAGEMRAGLTMIEHGSPSLEFRDKNGKSRAVVGAISLQTTRTEEVRTRSESSLVLFDKDGKVIWKAR